MSVQSHSGQDLELIYNQRFSGLQDYRREIWEVLCRDIFSRYVCPNSTVLDLGSGYCEFINEIAAARKYAMDLNPATALRAQEGISVIQQDCSEEWPLSSASLDVIFTSNFFEHLPDKFALERTIHSGFRCLKPGGRLIAMGPNIRYTGPAYWDFYDHYIALTDVSLTELLLKCGFEVERSWAQFLPYTMSDGRKYPAWVLSAYLRIEALWKIFGKQFLIVARKPA
ncbi:MAG: class I SAM-dependent methyltransferase [Acidobacteriota bacterium]|nr:class I SAM-dependent methyltransferase [Acidobacteriota bacterium]